jgi:antitoxin component YwqK of YwqJK toxin-antitoxin module
MNRIFLILLLFFTLNGYSCDCAFERSSFIEIFNSTDVVFQGKVISIKNVEFPGGLSKEIVFEVVKNFKGAENKTIKIYLDNSNCALGINTVGENWIIWAYKWYGKISTNQCTNSVFTNKMDESTLAQLTDFSNAQGYKIWYNKAGEKIGEGSFLNQKANGKWIYYIKNFIVSMGSYKNGIKDGEWIYYYEPDIEILSSECKSAFSEIYNSNNYKISRQIKEKGNYREGKKEGDFFHYNFDGSISWQMVYKNDLYDGINVTYFQNGLQEKIRHFKNNIANGMFVDFYPNGSLKMISYYENGQKAGDWEIFDKNGNQICKSNFKDMIYDEKTYDFHCKE